ncbi:uncharacterized protein DSM5745_09582 [Aspergillus mulundensis]|uniref:NAD-dependent epimerase/dehydratase domain-containing protein n=1 Tax=Aspergillus mulundensis TaxID=1810919 RepID=A0A3D8QVF5_9EURO|nr:hypothetical protein DSM5745_09582 [Aspergillus mulundensis]RDW65843.1 hypothetical protein DSM5745_09582 [Aspergillus mulundensis]
MSNYDLTLFGATGYTGKLCASFIAEHYPTSIRWCLAGRSEARLRSLARSLQSRFPDRVQPEIEVLNDLEERSVAPLIGRTKVVINGVGPFHRFSSGIVGACARVGSCYVDFTTETLWIKELIERFEDVARESGAILIPGISPTAPADLIAWLIAKQIRERYSTGPEEIVATGKLDIKAMSAGSLTTVLDSLETWGPGWYISGNSWVLSDPAQKPKPKPKPSLVSRLFGYRHVPILGPLSTSFTGPGNASMVHRSASQDPELYGQNFHYEEYLPAAGLRSACLIHLITKAAILLISIPLVRSMLRWFVDPTKSLPGQDELRRLESAEYRAVGFIAKKGQDKVPVVQASFVRQGALYEFTALLACVGAKVLLGERAGLERAGKGGFFTPSSLGMEYVEGLREAGVKIRGYTRNSGLGGDTASMHETLLAQVYKVRLDALSFSLNLSESSDLSAFYLLSQLSPAMPLDISSEKLLITGVSGYIGFKTLLIALGRGYTVRALVRKESHVLDLQNKSPTVIAPALKSSQLEFAVVPDFLAPDAIFNVLHGITAVIHLASPLAVQTTNYDDDIIQPAISMVTTFLEAATRVPSVKRVVITSSCVTLIPFEWNMHPDTERVYTPNDLNPALDTTPSSPMEAYWLSKGLARRATHDFVTKNKPHFDVVNLLAGVVVGPDDRLLPSSSNEQPASALLDGTRASVLAPALTTDLSSPFPYVAVPVHVGDVARAHVDAVDCGKVRGGSEFILASDTDNQAGKEVEWDRDVRGVARRYFGREVERGVLPCRGSLETIRWRLDARETERVFGWRLTGFEETVRQLIAQYLELRGLEE